MDGLGKAEVAATATAGRTAAETTVAVLIQAKASSEGLTRASIINAARNFTLTPSLGLPGVGLKMNGENDPFLAEPDRASVHGGRRWFRYLHRRRRTDHRLRELISGSLTPVGTAREMWPTRAGGPQTRLAFLRRAGVVGAA